jgi:hypothetical protein
VMTVDARVRMRYDVDMTAPSHQTVRLARGRHASRRAGVCVMELASMLAHEPFSDRTPSISPTIGAFLRTYNDGLDQERRQDLYSVAAAIVGTASGRAVERERIDRCLAFALRHGGRTPASRASLALATPEPAGAWAALTALKSGAHDEALSLVDELVAPSSRRARWRRVADPARAPAKWAGAKAPRGRQAPTDTGVAPTNPAMASAATRHPRRPE